MAENKEQQNPSVTSTNKPSENNEEEQSKRFYRKMVLKNLHLKKLTTSGKFQIPMFVGIEAANEILIGTEEFKNAQNIKLNFDRPQQGLFIPALKHKKTTFLSSDRKSATLLDKVDDVALQADHPDFDLKLRSISDIYKSKNYKIEIPLTEKIELDLVIVGSVVVSKDGRRIGTENGFNDLELGILTRMGAITNKTLIATTVHEDQVIDSLPNEIFEKFDYPVDIIVTSKEVFKTGRTVERPAGIYWDLLNERRVEASPTLQYFKTEDIKSGISITLKPISEKEENQKKVYRFNARKSNYGKRRNKPRQNLSTSKNLENEVNEEKPKPNSKQAMRKMVWEEMKEKGLAERKIFSKIPIFCFSEQAFDLLVNLDVFKNVENICTTNDLIFEKLKLNILQEKKSLYFPMKSGENVLAKVKAVEEGQEVTSDYIASILREKKYELINMNDKVELDLIILGSVLVSKDGKRIGNANRITDLSFGILVELGFITLKTKIVTLVNNCQIKEIPEDLMLPYDIPVDIIITPVEVINVEIPRPRPTGVLWEHVTQRQLESLAVLQVLKQRKEDAGEPVTIKPSNIREKKVGSRRRTKFQNKIKRNTEIPEGRKDEKEKIIHEQITRDIKRTLRTKIRPDSYCIKVSNITDGIHAKEFKSEIRKLANPSFVNWNTRLRSCFLHFNKKSVDNNEDGGIDNILRALENLSVDIETSEGETKTLSKMAVTLLSDEKLLKSNISRIESVDSTTV